MHVSVRRVVSAFAFLLIASLAPPDLLAQSCGVERWSVKTGTDADVGKINLSSSSSNTIATMRGWPAPNPIPLNNRVSPYETTVWVLNATLVQYKLEDDSDYHLVLSDASGNTLIAEIPLPACVGSSSPFLSKITTARNTFNSRYTPTGSFQTANIPVQITGVGMFDFLHGQTGVAPNGIEIHPVLSIVFNPSTGPDFTISSPGSLTVASGSSGSTTVSTSVSGGFNSSVSLSVSGLPSGASATFTPTSIAAPGSGSSTLKITAGTAAAGTYNLTITGTGGGKTHTTPLSLTIGSGGGGGGTQILVNPGFESGATSWTATSGVINTSASEPAHSGSWKAWLDGYGTTHTQTLMQQVAIFSSHTTATLTFWLHIDTAETTTTTQYDKLTVQVRNSSGTVLKTLATYSNLNHNTGYAQKTFDLSAYIGQTIQIFLSGTEDSQKQTSFVVDDFALNVQ
jgi:hypothetical protein